jgi:hypothetical protein
VLTWDSVIRGRTEFECCKYGKRYEIMSCPALSGTKQ